jgi:hypothetical protein
MNSNKHQQPLDLPEWTNANINTNPLPSPSLPSESPARQVKKPTLTHQSSTTSTTSTLSRPPVPKAKWRAENNSNTTLHKQPSISVSAAPIDLSLADDEYGKRGSMGGDISPSVERKEFFAGEMGKRGEKGEKGGVLGGSPIENADLLYEYFPLSLDDWYVYF